MSKFMDRWGVRGADLIVASVLWSLCTVMGNTFGMMCVSICLIVFRYEPTLNNPTEKQG